MLYFWDAGEVSNNVSLDGEGKRSLVVTLLYQAHTAPLFMALGLAGLFSSLYWLFRNRGRAVLCVMITMYWLSIALFYNLGRFRAPVLPLVFIASGALLVPLKVKYWKLFALLFALLWVFVASYTYRSYEPALMRYVRPGGTVLAPAPGFLDTAVLDHGPESFGDWRFFPLKEGMSLTKTFAGCPDGGEAEWTIIAETPGTLAVESAGQRWVKSFPAGRNTWKIPAENPGTLVIRSVSGKLYIPADFQRNYGRSQLDKELIPAEFVVRWRYYPEEEK